MVFMRLQNTGLCYVVNDIHEPESAAEYRVVLVNDIHEPKSAADYYI